MQHANTAMQDGVAKWERYDVMLAWVSGVVSTPFPEVNDGLGMVMTPGISGISLSSPMIEISPLTKAIEGIKD